MFGNEKAVGKLEGRVDVIERRMDTVISELQSTRDKHEVLMQSQAAALADLTNAIVSNNRAISIFKWLSAGLVFPLMIGIALYAVQISPLFTKDEDVSEVQLSQREELD